MELETEELYATPDDVADTMGLPPDFSEDVYGFARFSDVSTPTATHVENLIRSNMDRIDKRLQRSWREHRVVDQEYTIDTFWNDENGVRMTYFAYGGNWIQLQPEVRPWDPMKGDRLLLRRFNGTYVDLSECETDELRLAGNGRRFRIQNDSGKLYLLTGALQTPFNAVRISYRYGSEDPVPASIKRLCCLMTAKEVINMSVFAVKIGQGGDLGSIRQDLFRNWDAEIGDIFTSWQRAGTVYSALG